MFGNGCLTTHHSPPNLIHRMLWPDKGRAIDAMTRLLGRHGVAYELDDLMITIAATQECAYLKFGGGKEAIAQLAISRDAQAVAAVTEWL